MKKEDFHFHFGHLQRLLEDLQSVQVNFTDNAKDKEQVMEKFVEEIKEEQQKQVSENYLYLFSQENIEKKLPKLEKV